MWLLGPLYIWISGGSAESLEAEDADDKGFGRPSSKSGKNVPETTVENMTSQNFTVLSSLEQCTRIELLYTRDLDSHRVEGWFSSNYLPHTAALVLADIGGSFWWQRSRAW